MVVLYFGPSIRRHALSLVTAYSHGFMIRVLAAFDNIEEEAEAAAEAYYEEKTNEPAWDDSGPDPSEIAEGAESLSERIYSDLEFVKGQVTGLAIGGLYHLWERQLKRFLIGGFADFDPPYMHPKAVWSADFNKIVTMLAKWGWNVKSANFYTDLDYLHLVANVVKHGNGPSCNELMAKAPQMFHDFRHPFLNKGRDAEHLELTKDDFLGFVVAVRKFFEEFPERIVL